MTLRSFKTVLRCADYQRSRQFYAGVLGLSITEEWEEPEGRGCVFALGGGFFEIYAMREADRRFCAEFSAPLHSGKIDLQIHVESVDACAQALTGVWPFRGPEMTPWGQRWIQLRDPDELLLALYE